MRSFREWDAQGKCIACVKLEKEYDKPMTSQIAFSVQEEFL